MEAGQAVATPGGLRWAEGRGYGSSHSTSRYIYSFFVLRMFANPSIWMILNLLLANPKQDLKVMQELSFIADAEAMTACSCCSVWVGF